jgi:hypothetical protein
VGPVGGRYEGREVWQKASLEGIKREGDLAGGRSGGREQA